MEQELKQMFEKKGAEMSVPPTLSPEFRNRIGRQRMVMGGLVAAAAFALVLGGFAVRSAVWTDAAPVPPAEERNQEIEPMRNGRIVQADSGSWKDHTAPPQPGGDQSYYWNAFDQDTGSFLFAELEGSEVWVVDEDGTKAEFVCPLSSDCGYNEMDTFGPGPDEITVAQAGSRFVHVIGFDGSLRDRLDMYWEKTAVQGQNLSDLAWSPDGTRLAVSTEPEFSTKPGLCDRSSGPCGAQVWIFDRDGGEPQLVYTERDTEYTALRDLAWSPDGKTLALLVSPPGMCAFPEQAPPRLVALRVAPDEPVRAETLNVYDDDGRERGCILPGHLIFYFPFAWSPDGTRIAVTGGGGIIEISAENGEVLARHPGERPEGPLAWLPKR